MSSSKINTVELVREVDRLKAMIAGADEAKKQIDKDASEARKRIKKLNELILLYGDDLNVPAAIKEDAAASKVTRKKKGDAAEPAPAASTNGNRGKPFPRKYPPKCLLDDGQDHIAKGLCTKHYAAQRDGRLTKEEQAQYESALKAWEKEKAAA
jgi:hypothetical protein